MKRRFLLALAVLAISSCGSPPSGQGLAGSQAPPPSPAPLASDSELEAELVKLSPATPEALVLFLAQNAADRDRAHLAQRLDSALTLNCNNNAACTVAWSKK